MACWMKRCTVNKRYWLIGEVAVLVGAVLFSLCEIQCSNNVLCVFTVFCSVPSYSRYAEFIKYEDRG